MQPTIGAVKPGQFQFFKAKNARSKEEQESRENLIKSVHAQSKIHEVFLKFPATPKKKPKFKFDHNRNTNASSSKVVKRKYSPVVEVSALVSSSAVESSNTVAVELDPTADNANEEDFEEPMPLLKSVPKRRKLENLNDEVPTQADANDSHFKQEDPGQADALEPVIIPAYLIGFKNRGNTCYINASSQAIIGLCYFVQRIISTFDGSLKDAVDQKGSLLSCFVSLCKTVKNGNLTNSNKLIRQLKSVMETRDPQFIGNRMQDAQEFLGRCLDELSEDITKMKISRTENLISSCFQHDVLETYTCNQCGQVSSVTNSDVSIWCDVSKTSQEYLDLQQLLLNNYSNEIREKRCDNCNFSEATLTTKITLLPPILVIYLKRYNYGLLTNGKVRNCVRLPSLVDLSTVVDVDVKLPQVQTKSSPYPETQSETNHFFNLSVSEVNDLSEEQQLQYAIFKSQQEVACTSSSDTFNGNLASGESSEDGFRRFSLLNNNVSNQGDSGQHSYKLQSVVSHHGSTATSGHYVADVFRSDDGLTPQWFRYDDDSVTSTTLDSVLTGSNCYNGYILTYLYKPLSM